jgi:hypothetical protein
MNDPMPDRFDAFPQPDWNDEDAVSLALERLGAAHDEASALEAGDQFLWAVGDNEAGTYYPVALATLPDLGRLLAEGGTWTRQAVIESLIDLCGPFMPEEGYEQHEGLVVQRALQARVHALRPLVAPLAAGHDATARSATELLELIDDQAA